jgi:hypothetical protein
MRLIDADKLIDHLEKVKNESASLVDMAHIIGFQSVIDAQPTAYDVDAVVKQLEEEKNLHKRMIKYEQKNGTVTEEFQARRAVEVLERVIEIVKGGGVNGD